MNWRPTLNRWDAIWALGLMAVFLSVGLAAGTPFFDLFRIALSSVLLLLGISEWRDQGHRWLPTLSWALPLGGVWLASQWLIESHVALLFFSGALPLLVMTISTRAAIWWYEIVLRRPFKT